MKITEENFSNFKEETFRLARHILDNNGGINPVFLFLVDGHPEAIEVKKQAVLVMDVPSEAMENSQTKESFIKKAMPQIALKLKEDNLKPLAFCFISEAWIREMKSDQKESFINWQDLPKKEVLIFSYETFDKMEIQTFNLERNGTIVVGDNKLVDNVILEENKNVSTTKESEGMEGIFSGILNKYFV